MSNHMVNFYWEHRLPKKYSKPGPNASNYEVTEFMTNKYVHKKWCDDNWSNDPAWLYENKPKKFQKFVEYYSEQNGIQVDKKAKVSDQDEEPINNSSSGFKKAPPSNQRKAMAPPPVAAAVAAPPK